ncbi:MAG: ATPase [Actinobacteria bacterium]|nr:ATPase [Actinomycetota bacterium]
MSGEPQFPGPGPQGDLAAARNLPASDGDFTAEQVAVVVPPIDAAAARHLRRLVAAWDLLADLAFSDLLLYVPLAPVSNESPRLLIANHVRPNTATTLLPVDVVGRIVAADQRPLVAAALEHERIESGEVESNLASEAVFVTAIPVRHAGRAVAVVAREASLELDPQASDLSTQYEEVFRQLAAMLVDGTFPYDEEEVVSTGGPRVGDGVFVLDADGRVSFASPNAVSAMRRLGVTRRLRGEHLAALGAETSATYRAYFNGRPTVEEVERNGATITLRCLPLIADRRIRGAVVLVRDVTEVRLRDRELVSKDATIKEIHHRVKNNLQTISSLLRLQGRRLTEPSAKAAIDESVRRIRSIAIVHETLSRSSGDDVDFGEALSPLVRTVEEGLTSPETRVEFTIEGDAGRLPSPEATSLAVLTTELLQNVVDHAYPREIVGGLERPTVLVRLRRRPAELELQVLDDGVGLPSGTDQQVSESLGLTIVRGLIEELSGTIRFDDGDGPPGRRGTIVTVVVPVASQPDTQEVRPSSSPPSVGL